MLVMNVTVAYQPAYGPIHLLTRGANAQALPRARRGSSPLRALFCRFLPQPTPAPLRICPPCLHARPPQGAGERAWERQRRPRPAAQGCRERGGEGQNAVTKATLELLRCPLPPQCTHS